MAKYSICRAMTEIKTLKKRLEKKTNELNPIAVKHGSKLKYPDPSYKEEDFAAKAKEENQSVEDIFKRLVDMKKKIDASNATTLVKIGKAGEMTVQQALVEKGLLPYKHSLLNKYKAALQQARRYFEQAEKENQTRIESIVHDKNTSGAAFKSDEEKAIADNINSLYKVEFVDPLDLAKKIETLQEEIEDFETNVDFALSESNSTTFIEVDE